VRVGAFGWGRHVPRSNNPNRESKVRPCVVVGERNGKFFVVFGQSEPREGYRYEPVGHHGALGARWGLKNTTYLHATIELMPDDFECKGFLLTDEGGSEQDDVREYDLWLRIKALAAPVRHP
jgi:hypothetical protein